PFPGAATGTGGEIRDEGATGRGSKPKAGLTGFTVSSLRFDDAPEPWEGSANAPDRLASPLDIMIEGPIGAAAFNNEFGRPNLLGYFRSFEQIVDGVRWAYHKPIMLAGGLGQIDARLTHKDPLPPGALLIQLGGPGMRIGMGGGAASSMGAGANQAELDFDSVQRGNPEMQRRAQEVIDRCWQQGAANPILAIHDVGAGGLSNAFPELVNDAGRGAIFELDRVPVEESGLSAAEIWSNESQERYVLAVLPDDLERFGRIADRERCPYAVVGVATEERNLRVTHHEGLPGLDATGAPPEGPRPVDVPIDAILGKPPRMSRQAHRQTMVGAGADLTAIDLGQAIQRVLRHPTVANKSFLITIGDRSVGGLSARDQMVGPWQVPVADCAVTLADFEQVRGEAMALGERSPIAILNPAASGRMAVTEALTNLVSADVARLEDIKLSANWMAACNTPGQDAALYDTVAAVSDWCQTLGLSIPVGKDSLSMQTTWQDHAGQHSAVSPVSLVVTAFAPVGDVRATLTPQLRTDQGDTVLLLLDLGLGRQRLGGSVFAQVHDAIGTQTPDMQDAAVLRSAFLAVRELAARGLILACHDRSDGGLLAAAAEMAFAGRTGVSLNLDMLTIDPHQADAGDFKIHGEQVAVQRHEQTLLALFNEEAGLLLQVRRTQRDEVLHSLRQSGLSPYAHVVGMLNQKAELQI
ncbi:MAG TPA: phosphoribosylformylglycinamidine synthase, partial [Castellaniella sp.]|nr:phosphoribosylformylglycinamidine synthase [Castellaniella sp.]